MAEGTYVLPASNWMNDPNGLIHWKSTYHLFDQIDPNSTSHDTCPHALVPSASDQGRQAARL